MQVTINIDPKAVHEAFRNDLINSTNDFRNVTWLGLPIWQPLPDIWTIQETIAQVKPTLLIETGTNRGGSSMFYAHLMDLMGRGHVVTVDVEQMHNLSHPRITYLYGSSVAPHIVQVIKELAAQANGPVMVILDSDHSHKHVLAEMEAYAPLVTPGSYCLVQDGHIDEMKKFARYQPGPLPAIDEFLAKHSEFEIDQPKCDKYLITYHPKGWLKRKIS